MAEDGISLLDTMRKSMHQISGALIGVGIVLSVLVALVFIPAQCATLLKPSAAGSHAGSIVFGGFNRLVDRTTQRYEAGVSHVLKRGIRFMLLYALLGGVIAVLFIRLKDWSERKADSQSVTAILGRAMATLSQIKDPQIFALAPPSTPGLGSTGSFTLQSLDASGQGNEKLTAAGNVLVVAAGKGPQMLGVRISISADTTQYVLDIDNARAGTLGVSVSDLNSVLSTAWGGSYVNDFIDRGAVKKVYLQTRADARMLPEDLNKWSVRKNNGDMVPFSAFTSGRRTTGSPTLSRFDGDSFIQIQGNAAGGISSGTAMAVMENLEEEADDFSDVYFLVGLLTILGLTAKNAILIVEFAKAAVDEGQDVVAAQTCIDTARADIATYRTQIAQDLNALTLLIGQPIDPPLLDDCGVTASDTLAPLITAVASVAEVPSELLQRRPDVLAAKLTLRAANANIGAPCFPSITLTTSVGTASNQLSDLSGGGTGFWSFIPSVPLPVFDGGAGSANIRIAEVERDAALTEASYRKGLESSLSVLTVQRSYYNAQQDMIAARLEEASNWVSLYRVLGGEWQL